MLTEKLPPFKVLTLQLNMFKLGAEITKMSSLLGKFATNYPFQFSNYDL
jgi:hypothetical protein